MVLRLAEVSLLMLINTLVLVFKQEVHVEIITNPCRIHDEFSYEVRTFRDTIKTGQKINHVNYRWSNWCILNDPHSPTDQLNQQIVMMSFMMSSSDCKIGILQATTRDTPSRYDTTIESHCTARNLNC